MEQPDHVYAHVDQPAFEQMQIDQNISRVAIFFVCFLTIGVFYFALISFPVAKLLPIQQMEQLGQIANSLNPASRSALTSDRPSGALGGSQIGASAAASPSAAPSTSSAPSSVASAKPSAGAALDSSGAYTVQAGDTLTSIARKFNMSVQAIADANKMTSNATLRVGQRLVIPRT